MLREKRRFNAKLINISKKEETKKDKAPSAKLIRLEKTVWNSQLWKENEKNKD
mgnify:CR=1 FL=1